MYNLKWLSRVARQGLSDLAPSIRQSFNDNPDDDRLTLVYGEMPRRNILIIALLGWLGGAIFARGFAQWPFIDLVNWPAVALAAIHALLIRRYLFETEHARPDDFPWLAASMAPAVGLLAVFSFASTLIAGPEGTSTTVLAWIGTTLIALTHALGVAASFAIALAALCYRPDWPRALVSLAKQLFMFRLMVFVTTLIVLEIGIVGPIVSQLLQNILGFSVPDWLPDLFDQLSYAGLLGIVYLAVIGATWTVCRQRFGHLLSSGDVDVLSTVAAMAVDPEKSAKKEARQLAKLEKAEKKKRKKESKPPE
ncbi:MAG: hypothetical protein AB8G17_06345 [Gammaproteobacteria bacterium]